MDKVDREFTLDETLYAKKVIPKMEYEEKKNNLAIEISSYKNICEQQKLTWQTKFTELKTKIEGLQSNIEQLQREKQQYIITAPISGTITDYTGVKKGMTLTGRFMITKRSLLQLLYDKTDNWLNPKITENER